MNTAYESSARIVFYHIVFPKEAAQGLLFLIYINDIPQVTNNYMTQSADDSTVLFNDLLFVLVYLIMINHIILNVT